MLNSGTASLRGIGLALCEIRGRDYNSRGRRMRDRTDRMATTVIDRRGCLTDGQTMMGIFAWRNLLTRPLRTMLALIGLSIPILGILGLFCLSNGLRDLVGTTLSRDRGVDHPSRGCAQPGLQPLAGLAGGRASADARRSCRRSGGLGARPRDRGARHAASRTCSPARE